MPYYTICGTQTDVGVFFRMINKPFVASAGAYRSGPSRGEGASKDPGFRRRALRAGTSLTIVGLRNKRGRMPWQLMSAGELCCDYLIVQRAHALLDRFLR